VSLGTEAKVTMFSQPPSSILFEVPTASGSVLFSDTLENGTTLREFVLCCVVAVFSFKHIGFQVNVLFSVLFSFYLIVLLSKVSLWKNF